MLEKEFVPYNLAKQIKQLGFKQECFGYYIDVEVANPFLVKNIVSDDQGGYFTLAPLYQQAFRWLWNKTGKYIIPIQKDDKEWLAIGIVYKTYEEAELECLKKLIEIVKNKL